jgi:hypothetical protein
MDGPVFAASTPSDHRSIANLYALVKRKLSVEKGEAAPFVKPSLRAPNC